MLFNTNLFLFLFLPAIFAGFVAALWLRGAATAQIWLASASIIFYTYSGLQFLPLLLLSILANYAFGSLLARNKAARFQGWLLVGGITFNLILLGYFKYGGFLDTNIEALTGYSFKLPAAVLPVGISFYTFTQIAFLVDARRGEAQEYDLPRYILFVTFFPHLIAGPIIHHKEMMPQFSRIADNRRLILQNVAVGIVILSIGLAKKCLIADPLGAFASPIFSRAASGQDIHFFISWSAALAYTFQIYFDFSGYSDMALGLARLFGIRFPANFNSPYKARSIIDFWRGWHMTLSRFLRDYLYIPLGGNRQGAIRRYGNLMLVMIIGGFWHGANWTFLLWGCLHGFYLLINHAWRHLVGSGRIIPRINGLITPLSWPLTFIAVVLAWVTFRAPDFTAALNLYRAMFLMDGLSLPLEMERAARAIGLQGVKFFAENSREDFYLGLLWILGAGYIAFFLPNSLQMTARARPTTDFSGLEKKWKKDGDVPVLWNGLLRLRSLFLAINKFGFATAFVCAILFFLAVRTINAAAQSEFLYFQF